MRPIFRIEISKAFLALAYITGILPIRKIKDESALTALIHLGYVRYDADRKKAYIPNYEVATALADIDIRRDTHGDVSRRDIICNTKHE